MSVESKRVNKHINTPIYIYIYIYVYQKIVDFGKSDKIIKISRKVDKSNTTGLMAIFHSLLTENLVKRSSVNKEQNKTIKPIVRFSIYPFLHLF